MAKPSQGQRYAPLSPKPVRKPLSPRLFTNLLGQAMARQGLDPMLAEAVVQDLMANVPPGAGVPDKFTIHGVEIRWPAGRDARVLYPEELRALNRALSRNNSGTISEDDAIVRVARGHYEALWNKRNQPDYVPNDGTPDASKVSRDALSDTLTDALACFEQVPLPDPGEHAHHWDRSPGDTQDHCSVPGCTATQQSARSSIAGKTSQPVAPAMTELDARPNPKPAPMPVIEHVTNATSIVSALDEALAKLASTVDASKKGASK
jgi:hypothetical protein